MERSGDWCILRTAGPRTLMLARSLNEAGFEAWTPAEVKTWRRPRGGKTDSRLIPIMPTFVFARADRLLDIYRITRLPVSNHPSFSIFRWDGRAPLLSDHDIQALRSAEAKAMMAQKKTEKRLFAIGARVKVDDASFGGLSGVVEDGDGKQAVVAFGSFRMTIATWKLLPDGVEPASSLEDTAA